MFCFIVGFNIFSLIMTIRFYHTVPHERLISIGRIILLSVTDNFPTLFRGSERIWKVVSTQDYQSNSLHPTEHHFIQSEKCDPRCVFVCKKWFSKVGISPGMYLSGWEYL